MVYYVVACYQENQSESVIQQVIENQVLKDGTRQLGNLYSLTNGVSTQFHSQPLGRWTRRSLRWVVSTN